MSFNLKEAPINEGEAPTPPEVWTRVRQLAPEGSSAAQIAKAMKKAAREQMERERKQKRLPKV